MTKQHKPLKSLIATAIGVAAATLREFKFEVQL